MVNYPTILNLPQADINRQFYEMLVKAEAGDAAAIKAVADKIGDDTTANTILKRLKDIEASIGADDTTDGSLKKRCKAIETAIGTESTEGSILYRIKHLEPSG